ncbi:hypothetical protein [Caulobacter mirabilis]|uniref:Uncharacterized protein n=1 Tax=Caulobacter mirabilis TaxID=69666 RepID=A0A2D2ATR1_9CAUL|nr:hypothetical protein [Caulobacter mirabilis]ATQ41398.1 hypothetical protein CSW64_02700 [Caulobacter mirabilis]
MCDFISLVVDGGDASIIDAAMRAAGRKAHPADKPFLEASLKPGERAFWTTTKMCDCGTVLGHPGIDDVDERAREARERVRMRRKGWSEARIERAFADRARADALATRKHAVDSFDQWSAALTGVLATPGVRAAGLLLCSYDSNGSDVRRDWPVHAPIIEGLRSLRKGELLMFPAQVAR